MKNVIKQTGAIVFAVFVLSACSGSQIDDEGVSLDWFANQLQEDGIAASHSGAANRFIPADNSAEFILNGYERVDVYRFSSPSLAFQIAQKLVTDNPRLTVYQHEELVVARPGGGDAAVTLSLNRFMGRSV